MKLNAIWCKRCPGARPFTNREDHQMITRRVGMLHHPVARLLALLAPCIVAIQPSDTYA